ncbi:MAG: hypothetical protein K2J31_04665, partial [Alistipes sp.]|nr:hypothetical protein [Alistipes sp.]
MIMRPKAAKTAMKRLPATRTISGRQRENRLSGALRHAGGQGVRQQNGAFYETIRRYPTLRSE